MPKKILKLSLTDPVDTEFKEKYIYMRITDKSMWRVEGNKLLEINDEDEYEVLDLDKARFSDFILAYGFYND